MLWKCAEHTPPCVEYDHVAGVKFTIRHVKSRHSFVSHNIESHAVRQMAMKRLQLPVVKLVAEHRLHILGISHLYALNKTAYCH